MVIGSTGSLAFLKRMGIDTFDDIIDHSRYDHIQDWKLRINAIHELLDELHDLDWPKIYADTVERRQSNITKFFTGAVVEPYVDNLVARMKLINKTETIIKYLNCNIISLEKLVRNK